MVANEPEPVGNARVVKVDHTRWAGLKLRIAGRLPRSNNYFVATRKPPEDPGEAITRVLEAEREARAAIAECESRAEAMLADARSTARRLFRTTQRRLGRLHNICSAAVETRARQLETEASGSAQLRRAEQAREQLLEGAVHRTAARLTTLSESGDEG